jgi:hypothetical protein
MNISITFEESVKGGIKVRLILFRSCNMKKKAPAQIAGDPDVSQTPNRKHAKPVKAQVCKIFDKVPLLCRLLACPVGEKDRKLIRLVQFVKDQDNRKRKLRNN